MYLSEKIAENIVGLTTTSLTPKSKENAKILILDTIGCMLAGRNEPVVSALLRTPGLCVPGTISVVGREERLDLLSATLTNGVAAHALDFDDVNIAMGGHPSAPILPGLLAISETQRISGEALLLAFIAGFETETRIARSVNFHHYKKGWHPTATLGVFGAAAAAAKLLGLNEMQTATSLALCVSLSSGVKANFGTMTKPLHVGQCARNGLMSALLAKEGFTASLDAFEHTQGFFKVFNGEGTYTPELAIRNWASPLDIVDPGIGIKLYPCCDSTHAALDALQIIREKHPFDTQDVCQIDVLIHPLRLTHVNRPTIRSATDAKFSVQYCLARMLLDKHVILESFEQSAYEDPKSSQLMSLVNAKPHPDLSLAKPGNYLTHLSVHLKDGTILSEQLDNPLGRTIQNPAPWESIRTKFIHNSLFAINRHNSSLLVKAIMTLDSEEDVSRLASYWSAIRKEK